jgi:glucokinase
MSPVQSLPYAIGLDIGGTKIAGGLVALDSGEVTARRVVPTQPERGGEAVLSTALALAEDLLTVAADRSLPVAGIGVGVCELVDPLGNVTSGHTVAWCGLPVQDRFAHLAPAVVEADVRAAALAEARYGAGRPFQNFVYVTVGTGISSCLVQDGRPWAGARGNALVLATGPITTVCPQCGATVRTILEEIAAGPALVSRYNAVAAANLSHGQEILAAVERGDPVAVDVVRSGGEALGVGVGWLVNVLDPEAIVVGGGLGVAGGLYWESVVASTRAHIWADSSRDLPIRQAGLGADAGLIGAAARIMRNE